MVSRHVGGCGSVVSCGVTNYCIEANSGRNIRQLRGNILYSGDVCHGRSGTV